MKLERLFVQTLGSALVLSLALVPAAYAASEPVFVDTNGRDAWWFIEMENAGSVLTVADSTQSRCYFFNQEYDRGENPKFSVIDENGERRPDGSYNWQVEVRPVVDSSIREAMKEARWTGTDQKLACELEKNQVIKSAVVSGHFVIFEGKILLPSDEPERTPGADAPGDIGSGIVKPGASRGLITDGQPLVARDFVINDDLIVDGSACIGFDCVNGESFSFDTIRLKENNLRIKFDDTSVAASFPRTDWQLTANSSANGGASKFSIDDISGSRTPFTVEANARSHSLYVDDGGRIGNRTSTPSTEIHTIDGDTPTLRLQQDGSSGFAPQTWDLAGNETNFFVRDVSNGSTLPLRIRPGAPTSAIFIDVDGDVGMGTASPDNSLHVTGTAGDTMVLIEEDSGSSATRELLELRNNGIPRLILDNSGTDDGDGNSTNGSGTDDGRWFFGLNANDNFVISLFASPTNEVRVDKDGDMIVRGDVTANGVLLTSDRNLKTDISNLDGRDVLAAVSQLPISSWRFKADDAVRHIGPMAQDFHALFGLGPDDRHISPLDASGVALAAVQGLNQEVQEKDARIGELEAKNAELEARLAALEAMIGAIAEADGQ